MVCDYAAAGLSQHGYQVYRVMTLRDIQVILSQNQPIDITITDSSILKTAGNVLQQFRNPAGSSPPVVLLAGLPDVQEYLPKVGNGIDDIVVKPFNSGQLALVVERVIVDHNLQQTLEEFKQTVSHLQTENQRLKALIKQP